jgi:hypothetical protein
LPTFFRFTSEDKHQKHSAASCHTYPCLYFVPELSFIPNIDTVSKKSLEGGNVQTAAVYNIPDYTVHRVRDSNPKGFFNEKQHLSRLDYNLRRH